MNKNTVIFNYMVNDNEDELNEIFHALGNPTRREIIHMMASKRKNSF